MKIQSPFSTILKHRRGHSVNLAGASTPGAPGTRPAGSSAPATHRARPASLFRRLRFQLTALCFAVTGTVVAILTVICLFISESGMKKQEYTAFENNLNAMYQNLALQSTISHQWIRQTEYNAQISLYIFDNGQPLLYQSLPGAATRQSAPKDTAAPSADPAASSADSTGSPADTSDSAGSPTASADSAGSPADSADSAGSPTASADSAGSPADSADSASSPTDSAHTASPDASLSERLLALAEATAAEYGINVRRASVPGSVTRHVEFSLRSPDGNRRHDCYASAGLLQRPHGVLGILVLHPLTQIQSRILRQRLSFLLADLAAILLLAVFFWLLTARLIRPLQENKKKQMQFVASASHELRSPLTVILTSTAAVRNGLLPNDDSFLETLDSEGKRMSRLITDMLQLAGADNSTWSIQPAPAELDTLLLETWEHFEPQAAARHLRWEIDLPDDALPRCICDAERIRQLLSILIDNAFSYTPPGGIVRLTLSRPASTFCITVSDNGPGIPDEQKEAVFERFYRADPARKSRAHFGLGLCIAQEIALLHHAQLTISDTPGGGATFTLVLP